MAKPDFSKLFGNKKKLAMPTAKKAGPGKKKTEAKKSWPPKAETQTKKTPTPQTKKTLTPEAGTKPEKNWPPPKKPGKAKKNLEKELKEFHAKPKHEREKAGETFDFSKLTKQLKQSPEQGERAKAGGITLTTAKQKAGKVSHMQRIPTGIRGLDELVEGGFERGSTVLVVGSAGTGKTLFGLQFLYFGAKNHKEPGIYISFEEGREDLYRHSAAFGYDFEKLERKNLFRVLEYKPHQVEKLMETGGGPIKDLIKTMGAKRLVIDSITSYGLLFRDDYQKRENILELFELLGKWGCTSLIISELPPKVAEIKEGSIGFLTDAIISLYYTKEEEKGVRTHSCEILKMRGTKHTNKLLALGFEEDGLVIYPDVEVL